METTGRKIMDIHSYRVARIVATGAALMAAAAPLSLLWYPWRVAAGWACAAVCWAFLAWVDQRTVRQAKAHRRAYKRAELDRAAHPMFTLPPMSASNVYPLDLHSMAADRIAELLIAEDHRRIRNAEAKR
jgi:hypothetical protein